jgi:hypothetical protein
MIFFRSSTMKDIVSVTGEYLAGVLSGYLTVKYLRIRNYSSVIKRLCYEIDFKNVDILTFENNQF